MTKAPPSLCCSMSLSIWICMTLKINTATATHLVLLMMALSSRSSVGSHANVHDRLCEL